MAREGDGERRFPKAVMGWIAGWAALAVLAVIWGVPNEESDLTDRAAELVAGSGLTIEFAGRDAVISGTADQTTIDMVGESVYNLRGVHRVDISMTRVQPAEPATTTVPVTTTSEPPVSASPRLTASFSDGVIVLSGAMPDQTAIDTLASAAVTEYGGGNVTYEMSMGDVAQRDYLAQLPQVLSATIGLDSWTMKIENDTMTFHGMAPDRDTATDKLSAIRDLTTAIALPAANIAVEISPAVVATSLTDLLAGGANFGTGSATLSAAAKVSLDEIIEIMLANPSTALIVEGHTDNQGERAANQALSEARARTVVDYLVAGGVDPDRLTAVGYGEDNPIADNSTATGRSQNRRIEFVVRKGE